MRRLATLTAVAWSYVKVSLALRFGFFMSLGITLLNTWILVNLWDAIRQNSDATQAAFTAGELATYIAVAQVVSLARMSHANRQLFYKAMGSVDSGEIAMDLVRPIDNQVLRYAQWLGVFAVDTLMVALPTWLVFRLTGIIGDPDSGVQAVLFVRERGAGVAGGRRLSLPDGRVDDRRHPDLRASTCFGWPYQELLSGGLVPLTLLPAWLGTLALVFPFHAMVSSPTLIYIGRLEGLDALAALGVQAAWGVGLIVAGRVLWLRLVRRVLVQGG